MSTQLIEAGVDIDFAAVVRDLAGLDLLAQAAGRCNRNGQRTAGGRVQIVRLPPGPKALEETGKGQQVALELLGEWRRDNSGKPFPSDDPMQMRAFYERAFYRRADEMSYSLKRKHDKVPRDGIMLDLLRSNKTALADTERIGKKPSRTMMLQQFKTANGGFALIALAEGTIVGMKPLEYMSGGNTLATYTYLTDHARSDTPT